MSTRTVSDIDQRKIARSQAAGLPITRSLTWSYIFSLMIAILMAAASIAGLAGQSFLYPTQALLLAFVPNDAFNLIVGLPLLMGSLWLARRGRMIGLLCWIGALFYVLYIYIPYLISIPFNLLFLPYLLLVTFSAYTLIGLIASMDGETVRQRLDGSVPARTSAGILLGLAVLIIVRQAAMIVTALTSQAAVEAIERSSWIADFLVAAPLLLVFGVQLWRRKPLGYVAGAGLLLGYGILALSVIPIFLYQARTTASPVDGAGIVTLLVMAALCFVPFAFFARSAD